VAHFRTFIDTPASVEAAFEYLADFSNAARWDPSVSRAKVLTPKPIGVGARSVKGLERALARLD
jgi:hypothetical protein